MKKSDDMIGTVSPEIIRSNVIPQIREQESFIFGANQQSPT